MIILDTDAISFLQQRASLVSAQLRDRLTQMSAEHKVATSVVTYEEQTRGWMAKFSRAREPQELIDAYDDLLEHLHTYCEIEVIPYSRAAEATFSDLRKQKLRIGTRDLRIAAIALTNQAILMTRNVKDLGQVPNLVVMDWTK